MRKLVLVLFVILAFSCKQRETPAGSATARSTPGGDARGAATSTTATTATSTTAPATDTIGVGSKMPDYSATTLDGGKFELASTRDKLVLLNLWATWCGPCRDEIPELEKLYAKYKGRGFEVIGVSVDEGGPDVVKQFVGEQKMTYPIVLDPEGRLAETLKTYVLPTSVLIDRNGTIVWEKREFIPPNDKTLVAAIEKAL